MKRIPFTNYHILFLLLICYAFVTSYFTAQDGGDFDIYLDAAKKLSRAENIYGPPYLRNLQYYYSVFFALLLTPFSASNLTVEFIWSLLSYLMLYRTFIIIKGYFDFSKLQSKQYKVWLILTFVLSIQFILYNVSMVQVTFFILWAIFESYNLLSRNRYIMAGLLLGFAINIKFLPLLVLPYLFYRGYFKVILATIVTFIILLYLPAVFIGFDYNQFLLSEWWSVINPGNKEHLFETGIGTHSLVSLIPVYLTETTGEMNYQRNILHLNPHTIEIIINISRLVILSLSLFYFKSFPFKKEPSRLKSFWELSFFILIIPLLFPHQQKYAFLLVIPMISYVIYFFIATFHTKKTFGYQIAFFTFFICMLFYSPLYGSGVIGWFLFLITQHFRILTIATLLIIPVSLYCNPEKLNILLLKNLSSQPEIKI